jgi:hypothetical protein
MKTAERWKREKNPRTAKFHRYTMLLWSPTRNA